MQIYYKNNEMILQMILNESRTLLRSCTKTSKRLWTLIRTLMAIRANPCLLKLLKLLCLAYVVAEVKSNEINSTQLNSTVFYCTALYCARLCCAVLCSAGLILQESNPIQKVFSHVALT